jgi:hypothetical protein
MGRGGRHSGGGVDPYTYSLDQLAAIRCAIWTNRAPISVGPRPGQPTNINAMDYYHVLGAADQRLMLAAYQAARYTHAPTGPLIDPGGYHNFYPPQTMPTPAQVTAYVAVLQSWWNAGIIPIHFVHPDGWSKDDMDAIAWIYQRPDVQRVCRVVVPTGWEPTQYGWKAQYWADIVQKVQGWYGANASRTLWALHTATETDAPTGDGDDFPNGNAGAWDIVAPHLHAWLVQNGPYSVTPDEDPTLRANFASLFDLRDDGSLTSRLQRGTKGWPTTSLWPDGRGLRVIAFEQTSYTAFNDDFPESGSKAWGDVALGAGANGAGDSCTMPPKA